MKHLHIVDNIDSTSAELARRLPLPHGFALMARNQTAGRGRQARTWQAGEGDMAASFFIADPPCPITALPLVGGLAVLDALAAHGLTARCKWPNDIRVHGRKMGGLLASLQSASHKTTSHGTTSRQQRAQSLGVILGVGLNLTSTAESLALLQRPVTSFMLETGRAPRPEALFAALAIRLARRLRQWRKVGFAPLRTDWLAACDHLGEPVRVHGPDGGYVEGITLGIGDAGELLLQDVDGVRRVLCGDVETTGDC